MYELRDSMYSNHPSVRMVVAEVTIGLPGTNPPAGFAVLSLGDPQAGVEARRLIKEAVGPAVMDPVGVARMLRQPGEIQPAGIFLQCQTAPSAKEVEQFLPKPIFPEWSSPWEEKAQVQPAAGGVWQVTMQSPYTAADFLEANAALEPEYAIIRQALQRPYTRINGDYQDPLVMPFPNFVTVRSVAQNLGALAQCHLMQGRPEEALRDVTLMHDLCRILESRPSGKPMTLVAPMINVAVSGLYTSIIADGLALHGWQEPQLAALEKQLNEINLLPDVRRAFIQEPARVCDYIEKAPYGFRNALDIAGRHDFWSKLMPASFDVMPRGWVYQNMVRIADVDQRFNDSFDPADQLVFQKKWDAAQKAAGAASAPHGPYNFLLGLVIPNFSRAMLTTAHNQTFVHEALVACALERYRLAHNEYPETLAALVPQFLDKVPPDLIGGQPLHYRRTDDGKFLLYSVGWNESDDGGKHGSDDDWVWDDARR
jgi:hypothetical protein